MQMGGQGPWVGTVLGRVLEIDNDRESAFGETHVCV